MLAASWWDEHSGALTFAGLVVAVVAIVVQEFRVRRRRPSKTLDYFVSSATTIRTAPSTESGLVVAYNDDRLTDPKVVFLTIVNTGTETIRADDFDGPIVVDHGNGNLFNGGAAMVAQAKGMKRPTSAVALAVPKRMYGYSELRIEPLLMNRGDWFTIQALGNPTSEEVQVSLQVTVAGLTRDPRRLATMPKNLSEPQHVWSYPHRG